MSRPARKAKKLPANPDQFEAFLRQDFKLWLLHRWKITTGEHKGEPYSFNYAPFMEELCSDNFREICVMKCSQSAFSELFVAKMIFRALVDKKNFLYTFPAGAQLKDFVETRVRGPIVSDEYLKQYITDPCNLGLIGYNGNELHFRGVTQRRQIISIPVSELYCDEIDEYPDTEQTIYTLTKRMGAAKDPRKVLFSTPTKPGEGISKFYYGDDTEPGSDQREWFVKCEKCGLNQILEFEHNIVDKNANMFGKREYFPDCYLGCKECKEPLDVRKGKWIPQNPNLSEYRHGYHVSRLMIPSANLNQLLIDSRNLINIQEFYNSELGLPRRPRGEAITEGLLKELIDSYDMYDVFNGPTYMGVDQGKLFHVVIISNDLKVLFASSFPYDRDWKIVSKLLMKFRCVSIVGDGNPNIEDSRRFADLHGDRVKLSIYPPMSEGARGREVFTYSSKDERLILIDRERGMELTTENLVTRSIRLPRNIIVRAPDFFSHLQAPLRATVHDTRGNEVVKYLKSSRPDHYFHALLYALVALKRGRTEIGVIHNIFSRPMRHIHVN